ncbi:hypothetical protein ACIP5Y_42470 [Nocardia sp. NPDC088792]|uniref:hypothetical protein n=1 Tax=Nocardia sp. NPDC088792 TaxID=3364332 RepID=UPI00380633A5
MNPSEYLAELSSWAVTVRIALEGRGMEVKIGEDPSSAGSDPVIWINAFKGMKAARLAMWRVGDKEFELADFETEAVTPRYLAPGDDYSNIQYEMLDWLNKG